MKLIKKIYTILVLLTNVLVRRQHYVLTFVSKKNEIGKLWYYKFDHWGFDETYLMMIDGADVLCEKFADGKDTVTVDVIARRTYKSYPNYQHFIVQPLPESMQESLSDSIIYGRDYKSDGGKEKMWICPVTLFVLGRYPNHLYIKRH